MLAGVEIGEGHRKGERFVIIGGDEQKCSAHGAVFVDGKVSEGHAYGGFSENLKRVVLRMGAETIFADEDDVASVIDHFGEVEIVCFLARTIEDYVESDNRWFAGSNFSDDLGEERAGDWEGAVLAD